MAPVSLIQSEPGTHALQAVYFEGLIDLKAFRARHPHYPCLASDPLVIELVRGQYAVLTKFGSVVYWNCEPRQIDDLEAAVTGLPGALRRADGVRDDLDVLVGAAVEKEGEADFSVIRIRELTLEKLKIIATALGQSVALEHFELAVDRALAEIQPRVVALRDRGRLAGAEHGVLRDVGFVLTVRSQVLANLTLFDKPPEAWESEAIDRLDNLLYDHFDLEERLAAITQKVQFLSDLNSTFLDVLNHRKSVRLELIVVILIVIEVVMGVWEMTGGRGGH